MKRKFTTSNSFKALALLCICFLIGSAAFAQTYCTPSFINGACDGPNTVTNFNYAGISNVNPSCFGTNDFTNDTARVIAGAGYPAIVSQSQYLGVAIYIDLNQDGDFNDSAETLAILSWGPQTWTDTPTLIVPANTAPGVYR